MWWYLMIRRAWASWQRSFRSSGKRVVGGTPYTDRLEDDRAFGQSELARHGMALIPADELSDCG